MINHFQGIGNLGTTPIINTVEVEGENRQVVNMRVYFDRPVGEDFKDKGGFWLSVDVWGYRAEEAKRILKKGARAFLIGTLRSEEWPDEQTGEMREQMRLSADHFFIDSICVDSINYRDKQKQNTNS